MKANFTKATVEYNFGEPREMNIAKAIGNAIHQNTSDIGVDDTARLIYHSEGEIDIPEGQISAIKHAISTTTNIVVSVKKAAIDLIDNSKNED